MIEVSTDNIELYKIDFERLLGKDFINNANDYIELVKQNQLGNKKYHPFFDYWYAYNLDIKQTKENKKLHCSANTSFILELLSNLKDLEIKYDITRFIEGLKVSNKFYSTVFEIQTAVLYASIYDIEIIEEQPSLKTPDLKLNVSKDKSIYIECKSLQDFEIENNREYKKLISILRTYCVQKRKSNQIIISAGDNFREQNINDIIKEIKQYINEDKFGDYSLKDFNLEISNTKISDWDTPMYGDISIRHPNHAQFQCFWQMKPLFNGIPEYKHIILIGVEAKPILNFEKRIEREIKNAKKQIPENEFGIIHIQLPIHQGFNFENYINENYDELKRILETKTTRVNTLIISNPIYNMQDFNPLIQNIQYYVIPNMKAIKTFDFDFRYPFTNYLPNNIPDLSISKPDTKIDLRDIIYTPPVDWNSLPSGFIQLNMISPSGKTQFRIWKSFDKSITFDIILEGERICVKANEVPFILNTKNFIDVNIQGENVSIFVNKKEINIRKFI